MNRSKIEWCDHTWNPITGCRHGCPYCYARAMTARFAGDVRLNLMAKKDYSAQEAPDGSGAIYILEKPMLNETGNPLVYPFGFQPTFHRYRMDTLDKLKMGNNIFVGAMSDIFGTCIPDSWLDDIFSICIQNPIHNYLFLTKNPERYIEYGVPSEENMWYGTSITREMEMERFECLPDGCRTFISMEPILEDLNPEHYDALFQSVDWIILGAQTGKSKNKVVPKFEWIKRIVIKADFNEIPVFMKDSMISIVGEENMRREFPEQLRHLEISPKMKKKLYNMCAQCKVQLKKSGMITLLARSKRGEQPKQFGFMCRECFKKLCGDLGLDVPKLAAMTENLTIGSGGNDD